jgi:hypothetical protein
VTFHPPIPPLPASGSKSAGGRYLPTRPGWNQSGGRPRLSAGCPEPVGPTLGGCPLGCSPSRMPVDCPGGRGKWRYGQRKHEHGQHKRPASFVSRISTYAISPTLSLLSLCFLRSFLPSLPSSLASPLSSLQSAVFAPSSRLTCPGFW